MSVINTNIKSLVAQGALARNNRDLATAMERLSTGSRINSAADDAAGLSIATRMTSQVRGLQMAIKNAGDAMSIVETAEGASNEITDILQRMRELAVQSASDSNSDDDRAFLNLEVQQLSAEIDRIADTTQFNGINILDGSYQQKQFQIGANAGQTVDLSIGAMTSATLGVASGSVSASSSASSALTSGVAASGTAATATVARMQFNDPRFATQVTEDAYAFTLSDGVGATVSLTSTSVNFSSTLSRDNFVDTINEAIADAAADTTVTGATTIFGTTTATLDITDSANRDKLLLDVRIGDGEAQSLDLYSRLTNTSTVTKTAVTGAEIATALQTELRAAYDANVTVALDAGGTFTITDDHGRRLEVSQGMGDGSLFGTDVANSGALVTPASNPVNLSVAWESDTSDTLLVTNQTGGKVILAGFSALQAASTVTWYAGDQTEQGFEPLLFGTSASTQRVLDTVTIRGSSEATRIAVSAPGYASAGATMAFSLTDSAGHTFYSTGTSITIGNNADNSLSASLRSTILTDIATAIAANFGNDETIDIGEFDVQIDRGTIIFSNSEGRELQIVAQGLSAVAEASVSDALTVTNLNEFTGSEMLYSGATSGTVTNVAQLTSDVAKGATYAVTEFTMTMSEDVGQFDFELNGVSLASGTTAASGYVLWDSTADFATSTMKTKLDAMVSKINTAHGSDVVDYSVSGNAITFYQLHGGAFEIDNFKTNSAYPSVRFDIDPAAGQGASTELYYEGHTVKAAGAAATASGTNAVATTASLTVSGDDTYSMTLSDGVSTYDVAATMLDVGSTASADAFNDALEAALVGSGISTSVSSNGVIHFTKADGGAMYITSFRSAGSGTAQWAPGAGQGDAVSLSGAGAVPGATASSSSAVSAGGSSVAQISIASAQGASDALDVLDSALDYVNAERSKLGALANRLNHTVDNLSNVVAATQASRSRILDTDYAAETAELARAQIIQQAATAMLAQANQQPQTVLALLQ